MCKAIEEMRMQEREEGRAIGREEGRINSLVKDVKNLMKNLKLTVEQAMAALGVSDADKAIILKML